MQQNQTHGPWQSKIQVQEEFCNFGYALSECLVLILTFVLQRMWEEIVSTLKTIRFVLLYSIQVFEN